MNLNDDNKTMRLAYSVNSPSEGTCQDNIPVVIIHGMFGNKEQFKLVAELLSEKLNTIVYTVDIRNHGDSERNEIMSYESMFLDLEIFIEIELGISKSIIIGHSIGGKVAMMIALKRPDIVSKLVIVEAIPVSVADDLLSTFKSFINTLSSIHLKGDSIKQVQENASEILKVNMENIKYRNLIIQNIWKTEDQYEWKFNIPNLMKNFSELNSFPDVTSLIYNGPTLIIIGRDSDYVKEEHLIIYRILFPNNISTTITSADHWVHIDQPQEFVDNICGFIKNK